MTKKKKVIIICGIAAVVIIAVVVALILIFKNKGGGASEETAYVDSVADLAGLNSAGQLNRYSGIVEPQETLDIQKSSEKTIKDVLVKVGDSVSVGTPLFTYDTDEITLKLNQAQLDLESLNNDINALYAQISTLEKEKANASADDKLQYTTDILSAQNDVRRAEYNKKSKLVEIEQIKKSLANATVTSEIAGIIKSINENGTDPYSGQTLPFITILATGEYRVKGKVTEQNMQFISEGTPVIIRSRMDENKTWNGTISKIETNSQDTGNANGGVVYYGGGGNSGETSTSYPFYVELESAGDLMLGQHVFIEPDLGQSDKKDGIWLYEGYFVFDGNTAYAWVRNSKDRLEKRQIQLGDYDSDLGEYKVDSGLDENDYIAWPQDSLKEGMTCVVNNGQYVPGMEGGEGDVPTGDSSGDVPIDEGGGTPMDDSSGSAPAGDDAYAPMDKGGDNVPADGEAYAPEGGVPADNNAYAPADGGSGDAPADNGSGSIKVQTSEAK